ncbi:MAG: TPM domain-containing protein, partial [Actinomycetota bacterium]
MHRLAIGISFGLVFATVALPAAAETARQVLAAPAGQRVYDLAKVLPQADRARLRTRLQQMAKSGSGNGAIVIVQQVEGESIETFAKRIGNKWKLGGTSQKKGFVIVTAIGQRRWRFETNR